MSEEKQQGNYKCQFCQMQYRKEFWGIGHVTCPNCQQIRITVDEQLRLCKICKKSPFDNKEHWVINLSLYHKFVPGEYKND